VNFWDEAEDIFKRLLERLSKVSFWQPPEPKVRFPIPNPDPDLNSRIAIFELKPRYFNRKGQEVIMDLDEWEEVSDDE